MPYITHELLAGVALEPVVAVIPDSQEKSFTKIQRLVAVRERCSKELRERLVRDGFSSEDAYAAVDRALACGLVDDLRFGAILARSRISQGRGKAGIVSELERLGILAADIPEWPEAFFQDEEPEVERALELLRRKPPRAKNVRDAAFRKLVMKGYSHDIAATASRLFVESLGVF